jgi:hypothetical protein
MFLRFTEEYSPGNFITFDIVPCESSKSEYALRNGAGIVAFNAETFPDTFTAKLEQFISNSYMDGLKQKSEEERKQFFIDIRKGTSELAFRLKAVKTGEDMPNSSLQKESQALPFIDFKHLIMLKEFNPAWNNITSSINH